MRIFYLLILASFFSCKSGTGDGSNTDEVDIDQLHGEVLAIHDEVMPKMSTLTSLQSQVTDQLKALKSEQPVDKDKLKAANEVLGQLNRAESAMWDWMDSFSAFDTIVEVEKEAFLMTEKASAEDMKGLMLTSIDAAETYLKENPILIERNENM